MRWRTAAESVPVSMSGWNGDDDDDDDADAPAFAISSASTNPTVYHARLLPQTTGLAPVTLSAQGARREAS